MTGRPKTVHLIFNAHIDPVWLWPWQAGLDATIDTFRTMCQLLEANPEVTFCHDTAWLYREVEGIQPELIARIANLVDRGRWALAGGWWVQPDCNIPRLSGLEQQIALGRRYLQHRFDCFPRTAFNIDTFGHPAGLPTLLARAGQPRYLMMRPQEHEMNLPARLFRWARRPGDPEVLTFRVAGAYATFTEQLDDHLRQSLTALPDGVDQTACLIGVGDHGGGPTQAQIDWCQRRREDFQGWTLRFSSPDQFFDAVEPFRDALPLVTGELQPHAVGCYSVHREVKTGIRRAELMLEQLQWIREHGQAPTPSATEQGWEDVCLASFHDIAAGSSIQSAYPQVIDRLGRAAAEADEAIQRSARRTLLRLPEAELPRILLWNASDHPFRGQVIHDLIRLRQRQSWPLTGRIIDEQGRPVPSQLVAPEAAVEPRSAVGLLLSVTIAAGEVRVLRLDESSTLPEATVAGPAAGDRSAAQITTGEERVTVDLAHRRMTLGEVELELPRLRLLEDHSDTWSHGLCSFLREPAEGASWRAPHLLEGGPLRATLHQVGTIGHSPVSSVIGVAAGGDEIHWRLEVEWIERHRLLELELRPPAPIVRRFDGIAGSWIERDLDGAERPLHGWSLIELGDGTRIALICPAVFAIHGDGAQLGFTLLRSPKYAHHDPLRPEDAPLAPYLDRGLHRFDIRIFGCDELEPGDLWERVEGMLRAPIVVETTAGMESGRLTATR